MKDRRLHHLERQGGSRGPPSPILGGSCSSGWVGLAESQGIRSGLVRMPVHQAGLAPGPPYTFGPFLYIQIRVLWIPQQPGNSLPSILSVSPLPPATLLTSQHVSLSKAPVIHGKQQGWDRKWEMVAGEGRALKTKSALWEGPGVGGALCD